MVPVAVAMVREQRLLSLKVYLLSEAVATVILEMTLLAGLPYVPAYLLVRPVNFVAMRWVVRPNIGAAITALMLSWITYLSLPTDVTLYSATAIIQGGLFIMFGVSAVKREPVLALLWIVVGIFNLSFAYGWEMPVWARLNQWWQAAAYSVAFSLIAAMRQPRQQPSQSRNAPYAPTLP